MLTKAIRQRGFLTAELVTATALLGLIIVGMAVSLGGFSAFNRHVWTRQRCLAAAQAQLDSLVATGKPMAPEELKRLWPEVEEVSVSSRPGAPPWDGLRLLEVTAATSTSGHPVTVHLARYTLAGD